jgi:hypothetical protein
LKKDSQESLRARISVKTRTVKESVIDENGFSQMHETDIYELKKPVIIEVSKKHLVSTPVKNRLKSPEKISAP